LIVLKLLTIDFEFVLCKTPEIINYNYRVFGAEAVIVVFVDRIRKSPFTSNVEVGFTFQRQAKAEAQQASNNKS
jgi:hypothetical protein